MKKKLEGRTVLLHPRAKAAIAQWLVRLEAQSRLTADTPIFLSRKGAGRSIGRKQAWRIFTTNSAANDLQGTLGTHAMRKTFANKVHVLLGRDLAKTQRALGHRNINSTVAYLSFTEEEIDGAIPAL